MKLPESVTTYPFLSSLVHAGSSNSSMRFIAITVIINIMVVWSIVCIRKLDLVDIPWGVIAIATLVVTGKVLQKTFAETKNDVVVEKK